MSLSGNGTGITLSLWTFVGLGHINMRREMGS